MDKEVVVHTHMEYYSAIKRNVFESVLMKWVNLEIKLPYDPTIPLMDTYPEKTII